MKRRPASHHTLFRAALDFLRTILMVLGAVVTLWVVVLLSFGDGPIRVECSFRYILSLMTDTRKCLPPANEDDFDA